MNTESSAISKAVVAMSGGVDSSVAALLVARAGIDAIGVSMQVWDYRRQGGCSSRATCCAPDDFTDARRVAAKVGIPYYVFDFEEHFGREVIERFATMYEQGETPNPCIDCNAKVKFRELRNRAVDLGCSHVVTGHYARIEARSDGTGHRLLRGVDAKKDQSYFLYNLTAHDLASTLFPIGAMCKDEVREIAREAGLVTAEKPESQDICFVSGSVHEFLTKIGRGGKGGDLLLASGKKVGTHEGIHTLTVGQRRGLSLGGSAEPLYVLEIDPHTQSAVVGPKRELMREQFEVADIHWIHTTGGVLPPQEVIVQVRHRHKGVRALVRPQHDDRCIVQFLDEPAAVAPGQAAVFYSLDNQELLGGARIRRASQRSDVHPHTGGDTAAGGDQSGDVESRVT